MPRLPQTLLGALMLISASQPSIAETPPANAQTQTQPLFFQSLEDGQTLQQLKADQQADQRRAAQVDARQKAQLLSQKLLHLGWISVHTLIAILVSAMLGGLIAVAVVKLREKRDAAAARAATKR